MLFVRLLMFTTLTHLSHSCIIPTPQVCLYSLQSL
ncbi:putative signal peptide protein [Puccinia sorghi]|uniref:Putative signal peptide protein n=1 Tax=Puccinia sorghi TaxID=27349 RepID=A0A0L6UC95_9BASI|nr:putative signal peptide protein [Puccinia sorghi]